MLQEYTITEVFLRRLNTIMVNQILRDIFHMKQIAERAFVFRLLGQNQLSILPDHDDNLWLICLESFYHKGNFLSGDALLSMSLVMIMHYYVETKLRSLFTQKGYWRFEAASEI